MVDFYILPLSIYQLIQRLLTGFDFMQEAMAAATEHSKDLKKHNYQVW